MRCPIFCMAWTPEGRRLVTGASSGEFTLWNGLTFNFETILQVYFVMFRISVLFKDLFLTFDLFFYVLCNNFNFNLIIFREIEFFAIVIAISSSEYILQRI